MIEKTDVFSYTLFVWETPYITSPNILSIICSK